MLLAFIDEGGHSSQQQSVSMGGCLAPLSAWKELEVAWKKVLHDFEIEEFHMTDFESSQDVYKNWTKEKHKACIAALLAIMNQYVYAYVGASHYAVQYAESLKGQKPDPYYHCFWNCIAAVDFVLAEDCNTETVQLVFSQQAEFGGRALAWYKALQKEVKTSFPHIEDSDGITFASPRIVVQLQAADIVAYEINREILRFLKAPQKQHRYPFTQLQRRRHHFMGFPI